MTNLVSYLFNYGTWKFNLFYFNFFLELRRAFFLELLRLGLRPTSCTTGALASCIICSRPLFASAHATFAAALLKPERTGKARATKRGLFQTRPSLVFSTRHWQRVMCSAGGLFVLCTLQLLNLIPSKLGSIYIN